MLEFRVVPAAALNTILDAHPLHVHEVANREGLVLSDDEPYRIGPEQTGQPM